jgi:hypothetical protein
LNFLLDRKKGLLREALHAFLHKGLHYIPQADLLHNHSFRAVTDGFFSVAHNRGKIEQKLIKIIKTVDR